MRRVRPLSGLRPVAELAASRQHGDRLRYMAGCRCADCRRANTEYERTRAAARKAGDWNGFVPALKTREHIARLRAFGIGKRQIADAAGIAVSVLQLIASGERQQVRARTERDVLAVTREAAADHALVSAKTTWKLLDELIAWGYSKACLARELGMKSPAIQINRTLCTVRTAYQVERLHERLRRVPAAATLRLIAALRDEGYREERILRMATELAARDGLPVPDLQVHQGFVSASAAKCVQRLHSELTEVPA
jgi:hypothetical protein